MSGCQQRENNVRFAWTKSQELNNLGKMMLSLIQKPTVKNKWIQFKS